MRKGEEEGGRKGRRRIRGKEKKKGGKGRRGEHEGQEELRVGEQKGG